MPDEELRLDMKDSPYKTRLARARFMSNTLFDMICATGLFDEVSVKPEKYGPVRIWTIQMEYRDKHLVESIGQCEVCDRSIYKHDKYITYENGEMVHEGCK